MEVLHWRRQAASGVPCPSSSEMNDHLLLSLSHRETHAEDRQPAAGVHVPELHVAEDESGRSTIQVRRSGACGTSGTLKCVQLKSSPHTAQTSTRRDVAPGVELVLPVHWDLLWTDGRHLEGHRLYLTSSDYSAITSSAFAAEFSEKSILCLVQPN